MVSSVVWFVLAGLGVVLAVQWAAERLPVPGTVALTLVGAVYGLLPTPHVTLRPGIILALIIPPLLYSAALDASLLEVRRYLRPIASLSVGLVLVTALAIGLGLSAVAPGVGFAAAVALGAAVAPPDPVAALSVGRRVGLPGRLLAVIEGEGLLNDGAALTIFAIATAAATGSHVAGWSAVGLFLVSAAGGIAIGAVLGWLHGVLPPLREDALIANSVSLATPFLAYQLGELAHVSGVLAVVVAGLVAGHHAPRAGTSAARMQVGPVWRLLDFLLEGLVFVLIGQQVPEVVRTLHRYGAGTLVTAGVITVGVALGVRVLWLAATQLLPHRYRLAVEGTEDRPFTRRELIVLAWSGSRGVITLAAAYSLPVGLPHRDLLLYCAYVLVLVTLVGQGTTFGPLARRLGVRASRADGARARNEARLDAVSAALEQLDDLDDLTPDIRDGLRTALVEQQRRFRHRLDAVSETEDGEIDLTDEFIAAVEARRTLLEAQRERLLRRRQSGHLSEPDLRRLQGELDNQESQLPHVG